MPGYYEGIISLTPVTIAAENNGFTCLNHSGRGVQLTSCHSLGSHDPAFPLPIYQAIRALLGKYFC